jgi:hypothetical protein
MLIGLPCNEVDDEAIRADEHTHLNLNIVALNVVAQTVEAR